MGQLVDDIFAFAKERNYKLADETEFIESVLYCFIKNSNDTAFF